MNKPRGKESWCNLYIYIGSLLESHLKYQDTGVPSDYGGVRRTIRHEYGEGERERDREREVRS